jgi:hypothetical protein
MENGSIVRSKDVRLVNPVLSAKGFALLDSSFELAKETMKVGDAVKQVSTGNSSFAKAGNFSGGLLASFIKSMS